MAVETRTAMLSVNDLVKCYGDFCAVDHLSFEVFQGEIFGLLGPNGAGKSTTIRTIMDIFRPDAGSVSVLGRAPADARELVGYLPEERGLYRDLKVLDAVTYLGELKGVSRADARRRAGELLARVDLDEWAGHKVRDLSRGMQQKLQFVASLVHDPQFLIFDEPFQGLDPVNVALIKTLIRELQAEGRTVVLSAHEMSLVEALCDRIVLINHGRAVLYGSLVDIKERYAPHTVRLRTPAALPALPGVVDVVHDQRTYTLSLDGATAQDVLRYLVQHEVPVESFEIMSAPLEEIFIAAVQEARS